MEKKETEGKNSRKKLLKRTNNATSQVLNLGSYNHDISNKDLMFLKWKANELKTWK